MTVNINYTFEEIAEITHGILLQRTSFVAVQYLLLDSRKLTFPNKTIFFALHSDHTKNEMLVYDLYKKGVTNFVIDEAVKINENIAANFIVVKDTLKALQALAIYHRNKFDISGSKLPVIGITGSNGKTIVKEWLNQLLENDFNVVRSPKSYNSQIGVPLSVLQTSPSHTLAIFEAGISQKVEMEIVSSEFTISYGFQTNAFHFFYCFCNGFVFNGTQI